MLPTDTDVTVPTVHYFDDIAHVVIMDDCGIRSLTLKQLMLGNPPSSLIANAIGARLGEFLGRLHAWARDPQTSNLEFFDKNQQAKMMSGFITYSRLVSTLIGEDKPPALIDPPLDIAQSKIDVISISSSDKVHAINTSH
jgi:5-methylthioribose kinase